MTTQRVDEPQRDSWLVLRARSHQSELIRVKSQGRLVINASLVSSSVSVNSGEIVIL